MKLEVQTKYNFISVSSAGGVGFHQETPLYDDLGDEWCTSSLDDAFVPNVFNLNKFPALYERSSEGWTEIGFGKWEFC